MLKEEKFLRSHFGKTTPFKVPEGYFEGAQARIMQRVKATPQTNLSASKPVVVPISHGWSAAVRRAVVGVAASVCVGLIALGGYLKSEQSAVHRTGQEQAQRASATEGDRLNANVDAWCEYTMMDTDDMYAYMADAR